MTGGSKNTNENAENIKIIYYNNTMRRFLYLAFSISCYIFVGNLKCQYV